MGARYEYLEVVLLLESQNYSGKILWPKSNEVISEFIAEEWMETPCKCLNHFSSRKWVYVEGLYNSIKNENEIRILFSRQVV